MSKYECKRITVFVGLVCVCVGLVCMLMYYYRWLELFAYLLLQIALI